MQIKSATHIQQQFTTIEANSIQRSTFNRDFQHKTTIEAGYLYPVLVDECLPGDTFVLTPTILGRIESLLKPFMDNVFIDFHLFSIPYRLVWDEFKSFMGETASPWTVTPPNTGPIPYLTSTTITGYDELSIFDYMGIPTKVPDLEVMALPFRAYNLVWNTWYRDQDLQNGLIVYTGGYSGDSNAYYSLKRRNKSKDYFTSARPFVQKTTAPSVPMSGYAPVLGIGKNDQSWSTIDKTVYESDATTSIYASQRDTASSDANNQFFIEESTINPGYPFIRADLEAATAQIFINQFRLAATMQQFLELDARGGTRYIETVYNHFGVRSKDQTLQYPQFHGERTFSLNVMPVVQQSETVTTAQGNLAATGQFSHTGNPYIITFDEHEILLGLISIRADLTYQQGLNKMWSRQTKYDLYWPTFANLGEQAIYNRELVADGTSADAEVWGYQERHAEYRYKPSIISGLYRSNATQSLDIWHLADDWASLPALGSTFIQVDPPIDRVVAVESEPVFLVDCYFDFKATRPMPVNATPGLNRI